MRATIYDLIIAVGMVLSAVLMVTIVVGPAQPLVKFILIPCIFSVTWVAVAAILDYRNGIIEKELD